MLASMLHKFKEGGWIMWPILFSGCAGMAILIEKFKTIFSANAISKDELMGHISSYIMQGNLEKAIAVTAQVKSPLTNIVRAGLTAVLNGKDAEEVQTAMDAVALREIPKLERRIGMLAMLSNVATLLGLLGTVVGMIGAFGAVANVAPAEKATLLAASIAEAMNATAFGLLVAIPLLTGFGYLSSKSQEAIADIHEASVATLNFVLANKDKFEQRAANLKVTGGR
jgi:biopolymer transport protein ExbB